jgi:glycosyltransferase involved in cell wall biosynthesis
MKIACITQVRDECDIIELFVRINSRIFDHIYIIDNNSVDATAYILNKLKQEGLPISTTFDGDNTYNQDGLVTNALRSINANGQYDWFMFLDADEFLEETKDDILEKLERTPKHLVPKAMWRSWVPTSLDYFEHKNPLYTVFNPLENENHITYKAIIDRNRAPHVKITHGNHEWKRLDNGLIVPDYYSGIRINHFPIRSVEQITSKAVLNHYRQLTRNAAKANNKADLGRVRTFFQLASIHTELRKKNFAATLEDLRRWAVWYNTEIPPTGRDPQIDSAIPGVGFGFEDDEIQYLDLSKIYLGARFDKQMDIMHGVIMKMHRKLQEFGVAL